MTAQPIPLRSGKGRQSAHVELLRDVRDDLTAHCEEALEFVDAAWPLVSRLERVATEIGPDARQVALQLGALLARYERRHLPEDEPPAVVAA